MNTWNFLNGITLQQLVDTITPLLRSQLTSTPQRKRVNDSGGSLPNYSL
jgi:hypothetical protein